VSEGIGKAGDKLTSEANEHR
ncbi:hypothetical protein EVA_16854, partial [gut metagenome]